jgi:hypothetical protein
MNSRDCIPQNLAANPKILVAWQYLDLANLHAIGSLEQLDHPDSHTINLDD